MKFRQRLCVKMSQNSSSLHKLVGGDGSPYSCKMRAYMRYKRIPFEWVPNFQLGGMFTGTMYTEHFPKLRAKVIPVLVRPDNSYANDSTLLIQELESKYPERNVTDAAGKGNAFLSALLEDFGDEWCTKFMFEGRFHTEEDAAFGAEWQVYQNPAFCISDPGFRESFMKFAHRQQGRRHLVGSENWDCLKHTLNRVLTILQDQMLFKQQPFLFGATPSNADFALYGQLRQSIQDPLPSQICYRYPAAWAWIWRMDDLSGYTPEEPAPVNQLTPAVEAMLELCGQCYIPFLLANEKAVQEGKKEVKLKVFDGKYTHEQLTFKYQVLCLKRLREQYGQLSGEDLKYVNATLNKVGIPVEAFATTARL